MSLKAKGIVMFHIGRCGSTVLCDMLHRNPSIEWEEEPFEPFYSACWRGKRHRLMGKVLSFAPFWALRMKCFSSKNPWFGFDVKFYHWRDQKISLERALSGCHRAGYRHLIILKRKNYLRKVVSSLIALSRQSYHSEKSGYGVEKSAIRLELDGILIDGDRLPLLKRFEVWDQAYQALEQSKDQFEHLSLSYEEDLMNDVTIGYEKVCQFLDVEPIPVESALKRTNPYPLRELILNWEETTTLLRGTKWEWMLEDEINH